jgi:hypothetical protein
MNVEFTSRYGPSGPPSWLRGCFDQCEAMGWYPVCAHEPDNPNGCRLLEMPTLSAYEAAEVAQRIADGKRQADGWYFLRCPSCHGTGRVSWFVTLGRIPRWLWRGVGICWKFRPSAPMHVPEWSWWRRIWIAFKIAFLVDLGVKI